jgi:phosphoribosylformylglycinamidine synthase
VYLNPRRGAQIAVAESARNVACTGATPVAVTNCLNFGNPYKPGVYWQFKEAIAGIGEACRAFDTPVTGGNVSFYNESPTASVYPTPVIGMLGVIEDIRRSPRAAFRDSGRDVLILGVTLGHLGGSTYLAAVHGVVAGDAPALDLQKELRLYRLLAELAQEELVESAHDCADGGLAVALAEGCIVGEAKQVGVTVRLSVDGLRVDQALFGEDQSRVVLSCTPEKTHAVLECARKHDIACAKVGTTGGRMLVIEGILEVPTEELAHAYFGSIGSKMKQPT